MDLIDRQAAIDAIADYLSKTTYTSAISFLNVGALILARVPSAQPKSSEITDEQAILHLQSTGWMQNHDREMYESGLREQLADDSGSYDSLIPCEDTISRQAAISTATTMCEWCDTGDIIDYRDMMVESLKVLPSAQSDIARDIATIIKNEKDMMAILKNARPERKWIPCSERYPDMDERVLVYTVANDCHVWDCMSNRADNYFWEDEDGLYHDKYEVDAWMPLPEPYKRKRQ